jgi:hypothetical protein
MLIKIDISIKPGIIKEITISATCSPEELTAYKALFQEYQDIFSWSYMEMPDLYPSIIKHHIDTWPDITHVRQKQRPLHPSKLAAIKAEIDKLCVVGFIYPIAYMSWVSNPVPVNKNRALFTTALTFMISTMLVPKTTSLPLSPTKLSMTVQAMRLYPSWMVSLAKIKSRSIQQISIRPHSLPHGVLFLIMSCLLDLRTQVRHSNGP